ncbi:MAG: hypothetical protein ACI4QT_04480 [Kiritimatiellia bacterium]
MKRMICFVLFFCLALPFWGEAAERESADARVSCEKAIAVAHPIMEGVTAERLDRAVAYMLAQDPPFVLDGALYGECPEYRIPGTDIWVICRGFWTLSYAPSPTFTGNDNAKCRYLSIRPAETPTGHGFTVRWSENGDIVVRVDTNSWSIAEAPEDMKRRVALVLDHCDKPFNLQPDPEIPETGNQFHDFIARKVVARRKKLGYAFGCTNRCEMAWAVPDRFTVDGETYTAIPYGNIASGFMKVSVHDAASNKVAKVSICKYDSAFAAGFSFCASFGNRYVFGDLTNLLDEKGEAIKAEADGDFFFAEPPFAVNLRPDAPYLHVVWKNLYVVGEGKQTTREMIKALLLAGVSSRESR